MQVVRRQHLMIREVLRVVALHRRHMMQVIIKQPINMLKCLLIFHIAIFLRIEFQTFEFQVSQILQPRLNILIFLQGH